MRERKKPRSSVELQGKVVDEDQLPVTRAEVIATWGLNSSFTVYTDAAGRFQVGPLRDEQVSLAISKPGFSLINVTDHRNPTAVVNNVDAPNFLSYSGKEGVAFSFRLRLVTGN